MNPTEEGNAPLPDIKDIAGPETLPDVWEMIAWIGGVVLGLLLLAALVVFLYRTLVRPQVVTASPLFIARRRLREIGSQIDELNPNTFSLALSQMLEEYLGARFGDPFRYETTEEFLQRLARAEANALPVSVREKVADFLAVADEVKYGRPADADSRKRPLYDQAEAVLGAEPASAAPPAPAPTSA